ncbi:DegV family protein [Allostreptomyces psammosilenae]|uniref:DegV family protein with EDD domain n=1 Tax=Allostreptomyces psammosilenae TaxID=1892865 RepID=A0A853A148_9ACTN|nr:DegV family protein [Allostreptomyces psammosilenae]NYI06654.1 DegV family protein with EDD domain [Allostreptomyces psammosilenae]
MPHPVALVTDSTAYLPHSAVERHRVTVVPLTVVMGGQALEEGTEVSPRSVAYALQRLRTVTTSRPPIQHFVDAYRAAAEAGAEAVVSVHISAQLSGTVEAAELAAAQSPIPVRVVDSQMVGMALGYAVLSAARAAEAGGGLEEVATAAQHRLAGTRAYFYVDTLEYLRRGGRIGAARALLGSALAVKPLLHLSEGRILPLEKVRTASRAIARLEELAVEYAAAERVDVAVHHLAAAERAVPLAERLRERIPNLRDLYVEEVGAVIGAHVGPGLLAIVVSPH